MLTIAVGHTEDPDNEEALIELIETCEAKLDGKLPQAGLFFVTLEFDFQYLLDGIMAKWPDLQLVGCTTDGELSSELGFVEDSVSLTLFASDRLEIRAGVGKNLSQSSVVACQQAVESASAGTTKQPTLCIAMPESLTSSGTENTSCLKQILGDDVKLLGANAADQWQFSKTFQFYGNQVLTDAIPILMFYGDLMLSVGIASGWKTLGEPGIVTKATGNVLYEIDDKPALDYIRRFLGEAAVPRGDRPLAILDEQGRVQYLRASIENYDSETGSIVYFGDIPEGVQVQLTLADNESILQGAELAMKSALANFPDNSEIAGALVFSCSARKLLLGTEVEQESTMLFSELQDEIPYVGFYGYGEICDADFHNETCLIALLGDSK